MNKKIVWERIETLIKRENITAYKLGKDTGISTASLTDWKKGRSSPKFNNSGLFWCVCILFDWRG